FVAGRLGDAAFLVAAASLFWAFGGTFADGDYIPDLDARYAAVSSTAFATTPNRVSPSAKASLTLASTPGSIVFADDSRTPLESTGNPARSPIVRQSIDAGMHTFRVHPGAGFDDSIVAHVRVSEGAEVALVLVGATSTFREMRDQLSLTDDHGAHWRKDAMIARRAFGGLGAVTFACLLFLIAAAVRGAASPFEAWLAGATESATLPTAVVTQAIAGCSAVYLLARVSFLFELSPVASTVAAVVGAVTVVVAGSAACATTKLPRLIGHVAAAQVGFAILAFGAGSPVDAVVLMTIAPLAIGALALSVARAPSPQSEATARVVTYALAVAPIPGAGVSFAVLRALGAALVSDRLTHFPGSALVAIAAVGAAALSFALYRWLYIAYKKDEKKAEKGDKKPKHSATPAIERHAWLALAVAAVAAGGVFDLGILSGHPFTTDASWFAGWLTPGLTAATGRESSAVDAMVFALGFGGALAGFAQARNRSRLKAGLQKADPRLEAWESGRAASGGIIAKGASALTTRAAMLARDTDRFVIDGIIGAGAGVVRLASRLLTGGRG
ncbi:MAG: proton-conducting transporter membrane subunit, partial [Polyangiaceae bacterium]